MRTLAHIGKENPSHGSHRAGVGNFEVLVGLHDIPYLHAGPQAVC